eukprot:gnl/TRDRNA2_/TRDRNA2_89483_c0_seq1.p1 gnl/TRDRNA2_/TRDRNA2_89483_c0~~gnl/TRDRNA2_/TRDRNA2_89483_c0_seq1.p1  ORF type:complete len:280 (-),score=46.77 gnl/TRDRNA2_/TRDRNA2_89483_c0_seq1:554-1393(-)
MRSVPVDPDGVEIVAIEGKGRCLRFKRAFVTGDLVLREAPFLFLPQALNNERLMSTFNGLDERKRNLLFNEFEAHMDKVSPSTLKYVEENPEIVSMGALQLAQVLMVNAMRVGGDMQGLYLFGSKAEHSCTPCCAYSTEAAAPEVKADLCMFALREIAAGEVVTICYFGEADSIFHSTPLRRQLLLDCRKSFCCQCNRCEGPDLMRQCPCWKCDGNLCPTYLAVDQSKLDELSSPPEVKAWTCAGCKLEVVDSDEHLKAFHEAEARLETAFFYSEGYCR